MTTTRAPSVRLRTPVKVGQPYPPGVRAPEPCRHPAIAVLRGERRLEPHELHVALAAGAAIGVVDPFESDDWAEHLGRALQADSCECAASLLASNVPQPPRKDPCSERGDREHALGRAKYIAKHGNPTSPRASQAVHPGRPAGEEGKP